MADKSKRKTSQKSKRKKKKLWRTYITVEENLVMFRVQSVAWLLQRSGAGQTEIGMVDGVVFTVAKPIKDIEADLTE